MLESEPNEKSGALQDLQNEVDGEIDSGQNREEEGKDEADQGEE